jgi:hypothetical protein
VQPIVATTCNAPHAYFSQTLTPSSWTARDFSKIKSVFASPLSASSVGIFAKEFPSSLGLKGFFGGHNGAGEGPTFEVALGFGFFFTVGFAVGFFVTVGFAVGFFVTVGFAVGFFVTVGFAAGFFVTVGFAVGFFVGAGELVAECEGNTAAGVISERNKTARRRRLITVPLKLSDREIDSNCKPNQENN